jgi:GTP diphosphokinase / guanosine-3',5'-bis(diphosphate) 3'-diphosphatase
MLYTRIKNSPLSNPSPDKARLPFFPVTINRLRAFHPSASIRLVQEAAHFADEAHRGQVRDSGRPYISHPSTVAYYLSLMDMDPQTVATGYLHDTVEDTEVTLEVIEALFGSEISFLVDGVTKLGRDDEPLKEERRAKTFLKVLKAMTQDYRVFIVKLADRLHNMSTLDAVPVKAQRRIATETLELYAPLAAVLGIYWARRKLEDLSLRYLEPDVYAFLRQQRHKTLLDRIAYDNSVIGKVRGAIGDSFYYTLKTKKKSLYSTYRRMTDYDLSYYEVHDITSFQILTQETMRCYQVLGHIHSLWKPVNGSFRDFISMPKPNCYQSLHTTVTGPGDYPLNFQIRTTEMDNRAHQGILAVKETYTNYGYSEILAEIAELIEMDEGGECQVLVEELKGILGEKIGPS